MKQRRKSVSPIAGVVAFAFIAIMIFIAVSAVKGVFAILSWLALPLIVLALVFNYNVILDYLNWIWQTGKRDPVKGLMYGLGSAVFYPFVTAYLAVKAFATRKWARDDRQKKKVKGDYIKYEEVEDDFLELPDLNKVKEKQPQKPSGNQYDDMF
ncbi:MAG: hypothetical protein HKO66_14990 [Saprospiraceae bacterium]|nr:hypothetical protein [Bacteroidia bacterium]NNE15627.1 hypothetical protein [Saprospiraceae bacterium]NNL93545.1 hypothetical protein [Saprospiraceae bacterium]